MEFGEVSQSVRETQECEDSEDRSMHFSDKEEGAREEGQRRDIIISKT